MATGTVPDTIERTTDLPHPVERVWRALTDPTEFGRWFSEQAEWELRPGAPMVLYNGPEQIESNTTGWAEQFENITRYLASA